MSAVADPTLDEIHLGLDLLDAVWHGGAWCDPLTMTPMHVCGDCRPETPEETQ